MTVVRSERRRRPRRRRGPRLVASLVLILVVFALGIALGEALHDNPKPGDTRTLVRTLKPLSLTPIETTTHTGTSSNP